MNRTIKFRGNASDNGEWVYGDLEYSRAKNIARIHTYDEDGKYLMQHLVDPDTVGQFAGLFDMNSKEIYEGDIITLKGNYPRVVLWDKMSWALMPTEYYHDEVFGVMNLQHPDLDWWEEFADKFEIIGNIHDNPELLNEK